jgi:hypothetical protein
LGTTGQLLFPFQFYWEFLFDDPFQGILSKEFFLFFIDSTGAKI